VIKGFVLKIWRRIELGLNCNFLEEKFYVEIFGFELQFFKRRKLCTLYEHLSKKTIPIRILTDIYLSNLCDK
jgi:hypothetical protein